MIISSEQVSLLNYEEIVTQRSDSLFDADMYANEALLRERINGSRIAIVGAAGSIGSSVVKTLLRFKPSALSLIDLDENDLVELVRDLRSTAGLTIPDDFTTMPIGLGSVEFDRYFRDSKPFDYFLNLCAVKHVRSEKNIYCLMHMIDTNVVFLHSFFMQNPYQFEKVFSVSSDKAANPANMMGASKMIMEKVLLANSERHPFSTARFANVAFSDGSLPFGFLQRICKRQPLTAPNDVKRYFISHQEAGELCVISCMLGENRDVFFPKLAGNEDEKTFSQIAIDLLEAIGYEPVACASDEEARSRIDELIVKKCWPCYFFKTDTTGEKAYEEFFETQEHVDFEKFEAIGVVKQDGLVNRQCLKEFIKFCRRAKTDATVTKKDYVRAMSRVIPRFKHLEAGKNLDQKM